MKRLAVLFLSCLFSTMVTTADSQAPVRVGSDTELLERHPMYNKDGFSFSMTTLDGKPFTMQDFQDYVVILHCWSLSCAICFKELPEMNLIVEEFKDKKVLVVSLMDDSADALSKKIVSYDGFYKLRKPVYDNDRIDFQIIPNAKHLMLKYKSDEIPFGFPMTYVIKNGVLKDMVFGYKMEYGNLKPSERKNYKHLQKMINDVIEND